MEQRTEERITKEFPKSEQDTVIELLKAYSGPETERVIWDILQLSKGNLENVKRFVKDAKTDYRDILYWAEYYATDPMVQGRDPKQMVDDLLKKWGDKK